MDLKASFPKSYADYQRNAGHWRGRLLLDDFDIARGRWPEHPAVIDHNSMTGERTALSYRELSDRVDRIASGLLRLGVQRGDVVSQQMPNWWQVPALHLACLRIGAVTNILMPIFRERELVFMLGLAESKVLVVPREFRGFDHAAMAQRIRHRLPALRHLLVIGDDGPHDFAATLLTEPATDLDRIRFQNCLPSSADIVQIGFTSGSTGEAKGVLHTSDTLLSNAIPFTEHLHLTHEDVLLMPSPLAHQTGFMFAMLPAIHIGGTLVLQDIWDAAQASALIRREKVTFSMGATPFLSDLTAKAERQPDAFSSLRVFVSAGAPIPRALVGRAAAAMGAAILSCWGMTEVGAVTLSRPDDPPEKVAETDGSCLPGTEIRVVDEHRKKLPPNVEGRLEARACSMFAGYLKRPNLPGMDPDGWFDTGDLARIDAEGYLRITGRTKDIIIRGGENIPVVEIENLLFRHPKVQEIAVVGMPDPRLGERACAFVVPKPDAALTLPELCQFLTDQGTAKAYLPERLELLEAMPRTPTGKLQKFRLRELVATLDVNQSLNGASAKSMLHSALPRYRNGAGRDGAAGDPRQRDACECSNNPWHAARPARSRTMHRSDAPSTQASAAPSTTARAGSDRRHRSAGTRTPIAGGPARTAARPWRCGC